MKCLQPKWLLAAGRADRDTGVLPALQPVRGRQASDGGEVTGVMVARACVGGAVGEGVVVADLGVVDGLGVDDGKTAAGREAGIGVSGGNVTGELQATMTRPTSAMSPTRAAQLVRVDMVDRFFPWISLRLDNYWCASLRDRSHRWSG